ncbi:MAG TPA: UDP-N-acetylmuramoyl-tripeptide--D-alanyl-D-alanine ligase [Terrimicrobiaceae bacterium]
MDTLTLVEIADMCGGVLHGGAISRPVRRISKDTRTLIPGDLYLALHGENHDGNIYAKDAAAKEAAGAILDHLPGDLPAGFSVIVVDDTLAALHRMAAAWRDRLALKVVCVTGSSGKTSTKEFTAGVLSVRYRVVKTEGNLNNHIGLPLSILSASITDDAAVWEIGMNHPGEIGPLAKLARPDLAIITNIGVAHIEYMGSREAIAAEKGALAEAVGRNGSVILPAEDDFAAHIANRTTARVVRTGLSAGAVSASDIEMKPDGCRFTVHSGREAVRTSVAAPGAHMVRNALLAIAAGLEFGLRLEECAEGLAAARLTGGRLTRRVLRGVTVLDDTYNANPDSMDAALDTLGALPVAGRRIAVLGRMGELGEHAAAGYKRVGRNAARILDALIAVGPETVPLSETARAEGLKEVHAAEDAAEAAGVLRKLAQEGDIVLVKGSRAARMERVIEAF